MATAAYALLDPRTATAVVASAGHLPLVLAHGERDEREATLLDVPPGPPLGMGLTDAYTETVLAIAPDSVLLGYSDGLVERRGEDIDEGLSRLADRIRRHPGGDLEDLVDDVFTALAAGTVDDVLLVAVTLPDGTNPAMAPEPRRTTHDQYPNRTPLVPAPRRGSPPRGGADPGRGGLREQRRHRLRRRVPAPVVGTVGSGVARPTGY
jgi:hypothetical protein